MQREDRDDGERNVAHSEVHDEDIDAVPSMKCEDDSVEQRQSQLSHVLLSW